VFELHTLERQMSRCGELHTVTSGSETAKAGHREGRTPRSSCLSTVSTETLLPPGEASKRPSIEMETLQAAYDAVQTCAGTPPSKRAFINAKAPDVTSLETPVKQASMSRTERRCSGKLEPPETFISRSGDPVGNVVPFSLRTVSDAGSYSSSRSASVTGSTTEIRQRGSNTLSD
jgi:hypothetical protein